MKPVHVTLVSALLLSGAATPAHACPHGSPALFALALGALAVASLPALFLVYNLLRLALKRPLGRVMAIAQAVVCTGGVAAGLWGGLFVESEAQPFFALYGIMCGLLVAQAATALWRRPPR